MSKTHSTQTNKEIAIVIVIICGFIMLVIGNIMIIVPSFLEIYNPKTIKVNQNPIDAQTVNQAIQLLNK